MNFDDTRARLEAFYQHYTNPRQVQQSLVIFDGLARSDVESAWLHTLSYFYADAALAKATELEFGPGKLWDATYPIEIYNEALTGALVVDLLYPEAPDATREPLVALIDSNHISPLDWLYAWADLPLGSEPDYPALLTHLLDHPHVQGSGWLSVPTAELGLAPTALPHANWLLGMYVGTFQRAPESAGLQYWSEALAHALTQTDAAVHAYKSVARDFAWAAEQNGEWPDTASHTEFVSQLYLSVLGRNADPSGQQYWAEALQSGQVPRSEFLAVFLHSALQNPGDAAWLHSRIAVAAHAAHPEVSGPGITPPDLAAVLQGVHDLASALQAVAAMRTSPATPSAGDADHHPWLPVRLPAPDPYAAMPDAAPDMAPVPLLLPASTDDGLNYNAG